MARQVGPIFITGTIGDVSFYKSGNDYLVRIKGGPSKQQILKSPSFVRTRENISEFAACSKAGAFLRHCLRGLFAAGDNLAYQRMTQMMTRIKNHDRISPRGKRRVAEGLKQAEGKALLCSFAFNARSPLQDRLVNRPLIGNKQEIIADTRSLNFPQGASQAVISAVRLEMDLEGRQCTAVHYTEACARAGDDQRIVTLKPEVTGEHCGSAFYFLQVRFYSPENRNPVSFENGALDCLGCIAVDPELPKENKKLKGERLPFEIDRGLNVKMRKVPRLMFLPEAPA